MDLFGDLPEPAPPAAAAATTAAAAEKEGEREAVLFDDLPAVSSTDLGAGGSLLFDDLPPASSDNLGSHPTERVSSPESHGRGMKRRSTEGEKNGSEELVEKKVCKGSSGILGLKGYVAERKGEREEMQDAHIILNDITEECSPLPAQITRVSYFAVFDGHGGVRASKYAAQNLHQNLIRKFPKGEIPSVEKTIRRCLLDTFKHTDEEFLRQASSHLMPAGNLPGRMAPQQPVFWRLITLCILPTWETAGEGRVLGVLEVSRSIGDGQYKRFGVISVPDIKRCQLTQNDRFILLACDGLFKVFSPEEAVNFIMSCLEDNTIPTREAKSAIDARYEAACNRLANKAVQRGSADNVTVVIVRVEQ
ncbi:integrin-linked kinase-associated serine/threonine phosphatase 2C isoform X5 [Paroedura picta]|uniref:integrin-linked kinase-associated serine/threonine phosphatase 2C isoform X5 n=1 Tax=Paroedura picta TaxID=143630 RepID=UPI004056FF06